jgi:chaperone required for assembly of F1-ATPase
MSTNGNGNANGGVAPSSGGPKNPISDTLAKPLPKRFYKDVSVGEGAFFQVLLDGRPIRTPGKKSLMLPTRALAGLVADEWAAQQALIDPSTMPLTRFSNTAIDAVSAALEEVAADIVAYAGRDLLCYRAIDQPQLRAQQAAAWDPVLVWAREALGARFEIADGVMPIDQPTTTLKAIARALEPHDPYRLTALHVMTTLTGSAILALAHARGALDAQAAWAAAHVDEDYQIGMWGEDYEASVRRSQRRAEFDAASRYLMALA